MELCYSILVWSKTWNRNDVLAIMVVARIWKEKCAKKNRYARVVCTLQRLARDRFSCTNWVQANAAASMDESSGRMCIINALERIHVWEMGVYWALLLRRATDRYLHWQNLQSIRIETRNNQLRRCNTFPLVVVSLSYSRWLDHFRCWLFDLSAKPLQCKNNKWMLQWHR